MSKFLQKMVAMTALFFVFMSAQVQSAPLSNEAHYLYLEPSFTVNFGSTGKLKYIRTDIAVKLTTEAALALTKKHQSYLRHDLIMLLSAQEAATVNSLKGREQLRRLALDKIRSRMTELEGEAYIEDLYFSSFVAQN